MLELKYCFNCGNKLELKFLENEGMIPYCNNCKEYIFPIFSSAVSMIIINENTNETLLIKQYNTDFYRLVAGYINKGESAEEALKRELMEEVGLEAIKIKPLLSSYFEKSNTLIHNYFVFVNKKELITNYEVDSYSWFKIDDVLNHLVEGKLVTKFMKNYIDNHYNK